ncbi:MAG: cyclic nucleotide-binding domain-containing protein [Candidatus Latescibacterota bacterium]|nr:cyclic nucleotide-binding domain-containing protein [Candidatus Latescibacterota bacterium]
MNEKQYHLVKVIQKMEVFRDFDATEVQRLLRVCRFKSFSDREKIYQKGKPSEEMLVLLKGKLLVLGTAGEELATISPGMSIGEMGLFTGQPRSASISAAADSTALLLRRADLGMALRSDKETLVKVLHNLVGILSTRLSDANSLSESQGRIIHDLEKKLAEFEPPAAEGDYEDGTEMELESVEK